MKVDEYAVMRQCVESGVHHGWTRAHKHTDTPEADYVIRCIEDSIMLSISQWFSFEDVELE